MLFFPKSNLTGRLPAQWALPPNLENLSLYGNLLTGTIPHSFTILESLETMDLANNRLSGSVPPSFTFSASQQVRGLWLHGNNLSGEGGGLGGVGWGR